MTSLNLERSLVYIIDDNREVRESIEWILATESYETRTFESGQDCLEDLDSDAPACVIVDLLMPGMTGLQFCREICKTNCTCAVIIITAHGDVPSAVEALKAGAVDYIEKPFSRISLLAAVRTALEQAAAKWLEHKEQCQTVAKLQLLSPRERQVLEFMSQGMVTKQIASRMGVSSRTVDTFRSAISKKLNLSSSSQLARLLLLNERYKRRSQQ